MKRRCNIERDPVLRAKVHELVRQGVTVARIAEQVGSAASRPTIGRYVSRYKKLLAQVAAWTVQTEQGIPLQFTTSPSMRQAQENINALHSLMLKLDRRDLDFREAAVRDSLRDVANKLKPKGATPEAISFVKSKLLGLNLDEAN